jgi:hypothetical protein
VSTIRERLPAMYAAELARADSLRRQLNLQKGRSWQLRRSNRKLRAENTELKARLRHATRQLAKRGAV